MHESDMQVCNHCGVETFIQPPPEAGCNHAYYPENCEHCKGLSEEIVMTPIAHYHWERITTWTPRTV